MVDSVEGVVEHRPATRGRNLGYKPRTKQGYFPVPPMDHYQDLRSEMAATLMELGIEVELHHHEVATRRSGRDRHAVQHPAGHGRPAHDVQVRAQERRLAGTARPLTFMPKPVFQDNGSGMHTHQSLWKGGEPLFFDEAGYAGLSDTGPLVHRRPAAPRPADPGLRRPDHELATSGWCRATRRR